MIFREFQEFVTYPLDRDRVRTRAERLDTSKASRLGPNGRYPEDYLASKGDGAVIGVDQIVWEGDIFECMEVDDYGNVCIWTQLRVWVLLRKETANLEKLIYVPRHPPENAA